MQGCAEVDRVFVCERCAQQVRVCRRCDHGQRYCREGCAERARRDSLQRAGARYQASRRGRRCHAQRQSRYRQRQSEKVTHQGFCAPSNCEKVDLPNTRQEVDDETIEKQNQAGTRDGTVDAAARVPKMRPAERCAWCGGAGQRLIRFGYWRR